MLLTFFSGRSKFKSNSSRDPFRAFCLRMDAGDPVFGAYFERIGHFQARARQLTSQAFGRAKVKI
jgi:hypothetical protein